MGADHERPFQLILGSHSCQCGMVGLQLHPHVPPSGTPVRHTQCLWVQEFLPGCNSLCHVMSVSSMHSIQEH